MRRRSQSSLRIITVCVAAFGALGAAGALALIHTTPPVPRIIAGPGHSTLRRVASFRFRDSGHGVRFLCSINRSAFHVCGSPTHFRRLRLGRNVFRVEARTRSGATSRPAHYLWTIVGPAPPLVVSSPAANRSYNAAAWRATCPSGPGVCGSARVAKGRLTVRIAISRVQTGRYWSGQGFSAPKIIWMTAKLFGARGVPGARRRAFFYPLALPPDGVYSVQVRSLFRLRARVGHQRRMVTAARARQALRFIVNAAAPATPGPPSPPSPPSAQSVPFTISSQTGDGLYPGGTAATLPLTLTNPTGSAIDVTSVNVALQTSRLPAGCPADGFQIQQPSLPAGGVIVPAQASVTLPTTSLGAASIQMLDTGTNQDGCHNAALALVFSGSAHS